MISFKIQFAVLKRNKKLLNNFSFDNEIEFEKFSKFTSSCCYHSTISICLFVIQYTIYVLRPNRFMQGPDKNVSLKLNKLIFDMIF